MRWNAVLATCWLGVASVASAGAPARAFRLTGLERMYFEPVERANVPPDIRALLPDVLTKAAHEADESIAVRDVPLPGAARIVLRELFDTRPARIFETWWAVYDRGRLGDVWRYSAANGLADGKLLVNLRLVDVSAAERDRVVVRLDGHMSRPQGAWTIAGKVVTFDPNPRGLALAHVRGAFAFSRGYDNGQNPPAVAVASEREDTDGFEENALPAAPEEVLARCGFADEEGEPVEWDAHDRIAACVTDAPGHTTTRRKKDAPSFGERGTAAR
ncbi:MAG: hypothetical protein ABW221_22530 [Vicinamibacteria bacterium]